MDIDPSGTKLVTGSMDKKIKILDLNYLDKSIQELTNEEGLISVDWNPYVPVLLTTSKNKTINIIGSS